MSKAKQLHTDLGRRLAGLPSNPTPVRALSALQDWLLGELEEFPEETIRVWGLRFLAESNLGLYPIGRNEFDAPVELRRLVQVQPSSWDTFGMMLHGKFWEAMTLSSGVWCRNCDGAELGVLHDTIQDRLVLECKQCGWVETLDGGAVYNTKLALPTTSVLDRFSQPLVDRLGIEIQTR